MPLIVDLASLGEHFEDILSPCVSSKANCETLSFILRAIVLDSVQQTRLSQDRCVDVAWTQILRLKFASSTRICQYVSLHISPRRHPQKRPRSTSSFGGLRPWSGASCIAEIAQSYIHHSSSIHQPIRSHINGVIRQQDPRMHRYISLERYRNSMQGLNLRSTYIRAFSNSHLTSN